MKNFESKSQKLGEISSLENLKKFSLRLEEKWILKLTSAKVEVEVEAELGNIKP